MMTGQVVGMREAIIRLTIRGTNKRRHEVEAIVDTGYTGYLTLPPKMISDLKLVWKRRQRARLADGSKAIFDVYEATIFWNRKLRRVVVDEIDSDSLLGMSMLANHEMVMKIVDGGEVMIQPLP